MNSVFIHNDGNQLGRCIREKFSADSRFKVFSLPGEPDRDRLNRLEKELCDNSIFIFNSGFHDESDKANLEYAHDVCSQLNHLFMLVNTSARALVSKEYCAKFIFLTVNPGVSHVSSFPTAPVYDEAVHSLVRSLAKELWPFKIHCYGVCMEPVSEFLKPEEIRTYRKRMKVYACRKSPVKAGDVASFLKSLALSDNRLLSGNILSVGAGVEQVSV